MVAEKKVIVVTGASSGIGNAIATLLAKRGHRVYGACRNPAAHKKSADEFFDLVAMDVNESSSVDAAFATILEKEKRIDALVCCAGMGIAGSIEETSIEEAKAQFETNFFGTLRTIKAVLPHFRALRTGRIVVLSSIAGRLGIPFQSLYSSTKFALEGMVEALRMELHEFGVKVCLVEPGDYRTGFTAARKLAAAYVAAGKDSPYHGNHEAAIGQQEHDEKAGHDPFEVARLVEGLLSSRDLAVRYSVGPFIQRLAPVAKPILPSRTFEAIIRMIYNVKGSRKNGDQKN